ncbi:RNA-binding protein [Fluviicola sp.]|uniref:RNA recognition motif domain-containing protein n=1 Tax=Fluviicola sp. TaxID=1917219 RepID=UPI0031E0AB6A
MTSIFVAKLDFNATEEQLKSLFEEYGRVNRVTIAKDRETGKPRGFAFVEMADESEADQAIEALDNYAINGRNIAVKKADDRASGGKPSGGGDNRSGDRPYKSDRPREDRSNTNEYKSDYKKPDDNRVSKPAFTNPDDIIPAKVERKKEKDTRSIGGNAGKETPKKPKMEAYRKSGKDNQFLDDDDLTDEELDLFGRNEEEEEDEDYRKYLVNSDDEDDSDEDYDDEDEYDEEEEDDDDEK